MNETEFINLAIRGSTGAWVETHGKIYGKDRSKGLIRPTLNALQVKACAVIDKMREMELPIRICGLKPRQKGSSTIYAAETYCSLRRNSTAGCVIAGQYSQTSEIMEMLKTYGSNDSFSWGNTGEINSKEGRWTNGSRLKFETAGDKLAGISSTLQTILCSEVARWAGQGVSNANEVLSNLLKCCPLLPGTLVILESTAEGSTGAFYERFITAVDAEDFLSGAVDVPPGGYVRLFSAWFEFEDSAIRLTEEQKKNAETTIDTDDEYMGERELIQLYGVTGEDGVLRLGKAVKNFDYLEQLSWRRYAIREECRRDINVFNRDFPSSWTVAFQKSGNLRFNSTGLAVLRKRLVACTPQHGLIEETKDGRVSFRRTEQGEARFTVFEKPRPGSRYMLSVDPMTGASQIGGTDPDMHGVFVLRSGFWSNQGRWVRPAAVARVVPCRVDIDVLEESIWKLARMYGNAQSGCIICVETNQDRGLIELLKLRSANLYRRELWNRTDAKTTQAYGYQTTTKTRERLIEGLAAAIREWDTDGGGIDIWCPHALEQCENFVVKPSGRSEAGENHHDDDVFGIGLGLAVLDQGTIYVPDRSFGLPPDLRPVGGAPRTPSAYS